MFKKFLTLLRSLFNRVKGVPSTPAVPIPSPVQPSDPSPLPVAPSPTPTPSNPILDSYKGSNPQYVEEGGIKQPSAPSDKRGFDLTGTEDGDFKENDLGPYYNTYSWKSSVTRRVEFRIVDTPQPSPSSVKKITIYVTGPKGVASPTQVIDPPHVYPIGFDAVAGETYCLMIYPDAPVRYKIEVRTNV